MRRYFVAGNWKMHGTLAENQTRLNQLGNGLKGSDQLDVAVFATAPYLFQCKSLLGGSNIAWGAQTLSEYAQGAFTGEVSASMLQDFGCAYVLVGHSERRELFAESDAQVAAKFKAAQQQRITPVLCVGESLAQRELGETQSVIIRQLQAVIAEVGIKAMAQSVIAYEPIWAIGTGKTASPEQAQEVHSAIREFLAGFDADVAANIQIVYGGSVKASNAKAIFAQADVDGALVGGASLVAKEFIQICEAAK